MSKLILTRHGQSVWNAENRFTGWVDVDLSKKGILEAQISGELIKNLDIKIDVSYTSFLKRAIKTLTTILKENSVHFDKIGIITKKDIIINSEPILTVDDLRDCNKTWLKEYMAS